MKFLTIASLALTLLTACGDEARPPFQPEPGVRGKPNAAVGVIDVAVIKRPTPDRAWIRATWQPAPDAKGCRVQFLTPRGATLLEGDAVIEVGSEGGEATWLVDFPPDQDLDAAVALCATTALGESACESYVVLARASSR